MRAKLNELGWFNRRNFADRASSTSSNPSYEQRRSPKEQETTAFEGTDQSGHQFESLMDIMSGLDNAMGKDIVWT